MGVEQGALTVRRTKRRMQDCNLLSFLMNAAESGTALSRRHPGKVLRCQALLQQ